MDAILWHYYLETQKTIDRHIHKRLNEGSPNMPKTRK
jgi:hypothetical protein